MKFRKIIPYKLKRIIPMAAIAGATLIPNASCTKEPPQHDTTYVWGYGNWKNVRPANRVAASADSVNVRYVYLLNDGTPLSGAPTTIILEDE